MILSGQYDTCLLFPREILLLAIAVLLILLTIVVLRYDFAKSALSLVANGSPRLCTDQMEEWTTAEAALFEEAMEKHGKTFNDIWTEYLPWKTVKVYLLVVLIIAFID